MLVFYMVHVTDNIGQAQLLTGDVVQLEELLPTSQVVSQFHKDRDQQKPTRLTVEEAQTLLEELRALDQNSLDEKYYRSALHPEYTSTKKELVEGFIEFLAAELRHLAVT